VIYRVRPEWIAKKRRAARWIAPLMALFGVGLIAFVLLPRVNWARQEDRRAALIVSIVVVCGMAFGTFVGRFSFRLKSQRWESFAVEVTADELVRQMDGEETRIARENVVSIREYPRRGMVVTDRIGWRIFVPQTVENYSGFREEILKWGK
jgi:multisubunit Na+/H+ antiporter MnhB subunit